MKKAAHKTNRWMFFVFSLTAVIFWLQNDFAQAPAAPAHKGDRTILIQESTGKRDDPAKVFVESGSEEIAGSPESGRKPAYRTWDQKCTEWKNELERRNGRNLLVASCGTPKKTVEREQSDSIYTYTSMGRYKIKVLGK